jgi:hypothetical protein
MLLDDDVVGGHPYLRSVTRSIMGCRPDRVCGWAMAGIARNIELYNSAYDLAWKHISELRKREQPEIARRLHDAIRGLLKDGANEPLFIASDALKAIDERSEAGNAAPSELNRRRWFNLFSRH